MTYKLSDERRKRLTEMLLWECWHSHYLFRDEQRLCFKCDKNHGNRTFDNDTDMMAIYRAIYKNGEWGRFIKWMIRKGLHGILEMTSDNWCLLSSEDAAWLFCLDELEYEARCWLVSEWLMEAEI